MPSLCWSLRMRIMDTFAIITSRKRAILALIHSIFFLLVAGVQLALSHANAFSLHGVKTGGVILLAIYTVVTTVLLILLWASDCVKEKLYFAFCASSAAFGLVRILLGDPVLHANWWRVFFLTCAVLTGLLILRTHSEATNISETAAR